MNRGPKNSNLCRPELELTTSNWWLLNIDWFKLGPRILSMKMLFMGTNRGPTSTMVLLE